MNRKAKNFYSSLTKNILGISAEKRIEEFEKADIEVKTVRLLDNDMPKEHLSFPAFEYKELINEDWETSDLKNKLDKKFFFVFFQYNGKELLLQKVKFWNMPLIDLEQARTVWTNTIKTIIDGNIVRDIKNGIRYTYFTGSSENSVCHVRPHASNANDCFTLPCPDQLTGLKAYTKQSFWLNAKYILKTIYLDT